VTTIVSVKDVNTTSVACSNIEAKSEMLSFYDGLMVFTFFWKKSSLNNCPFEESLSDVVTRRNNLKAVLQIKNSFSRL